MFFILVTGLDETYRIKQRNKEMLTKSTSTSEWSLRTLRESMFWATFHQIQRDSYKMLLICNMGNVRYSVFVARPTQKTKSQTILASAA